MSAVYISPLAGQSLVAGLKEKNIRVCFTSPAKTLGPAVAAHPDMLMCRLGATAGFPLVFASEEELSPVYPGDAAYNALCLDKYFVHRLDITDKTLLKRAVSMGLIPVNVRQGYTKCGVVSVDGRAVITSDPGIAGALLELGDVEVLEIKQGFVVLEGYETGFIGGTSGRIGKEIWFNGDLSAHPDYEKIKTFISARGLGLRYFKDYPLTDIGSIIETN